MCLFVGATLVSPVFDFAWRKRAGLRPAPTKKRRGRHKCRPYRRAGEGDLDEESAGGCGGVGGGAAGLSCDFSVAESDAGAEAAGGGWAAGGGSGEQVGSE